MKGSKLRGLVSVKLKTEKHWTDFLWLYENESSKRKKEKVDNKWRRQKDKQALAEIKETESFARGR